ncbi:hypothetical protein Tco_1195454 [Tanacetum coccineum]
MNMALVLMAKSFKLNYSTPTNNNQRILSNPHNRQIAQSSMNLGQDRQMQMVKGNEGISLDRITGIRYGVTTVQDWVMLLGTAQSGQEKRMLPIFKHSYLEEIEEVNANSILMANLQQASTSGTQIGKALVYDSDGSTEVHQYDNCYNNEIFNTFTQEEQYTELLEPISKPHQA